MGAAAHAEDGVIHAIAKIEQARVSTIFMRPLGDTEILVPSLLSALCSLLSALYALLSTLYQKNDGLPSPCAQRSKALLLTSSHLHIFTSSHLPGKSEHRRNRPATSVALPLHHLQASTHHQLRPRSLLYIFRRQPRRDFLEHNPLRRHPHVPHLGNNRIHHAHPSKRERALLQNLRCPRLRAMFHGDHNPPRPRHQIHRPAHSLHHFSRNHPICQIPRGIHFHRPQHAQIHMPAANHGKRIGAREVRRPRQLCHRLFSRVDQVRILAPGHRIRPNPQHPVLALENHIHPRRHIIRHQGGHSNPQIHIKSVAQLPSNPLHNTFALDNLIFRPSRHN